VLYVQLADAKRDTWGYKPCEDRKYYSAIANSVSYGGDSYGNPRNLMLTAKYGF
jgi:outer membrane receptor for ferric coprogen and ferric-rhodotorulic acid